MKSRPVQIIPEPQRGLAFHLIKWILISFAVLNILSSIWVGIYMEKAVKYAVEDTPDVNGHYVDGDRRDSAKVWKGFIIAFLVIIDLINLLGVFGAFMENYNLIMIYGVVMMAYSIFTAVNDYTRGSYSSYIVPFFVAVMAFVFAHKIHVSTPQPTVYTPAATA